MKRGLLKFTGLVYRISQSSLDSVDVGLNIPWDRKKCEELPFGDYEITFKPINTKREKRRTP